MKDLYLEKAETFAGKKLPFPDLKAPCRAADGFIGKAAAVFPQYQMKTPDPVPFQQRQDLFQRIFLCKKDHSFLPVQKGDLLRKKEDIGHDHFHIRMCQCLYIGGGILLFHLQNTISCQIDCHRKDHQSGSHIPDAFPEKIFFRQNHKSQNT